MKLRPLSATASASAAPGGRCRLCGAGLQRSWSTSACRRSARASCRPSSSTRWSRSIRCTCWSASSCFLVQLEEYVSPEQIFTRVRLLLVLLDQLGRACAALLRDDHRAARARTRDSLVVELASNDGYLLQHFVPRGVPVLGIEPAANVAEAARRARASRRWSSSSASSLAERAGRRGQAGRPDRRQQRAGAGARPQRLRRRHAASC